MGNSPTVDAPTRRQPHDPPRAGRGTLYPKHHTTTFNPPRNGQGAKSGFQGIIIEECRVTKKNKLVKARLTRAGMLYLLVAGCIFAASFIQQVNLLLLLFTMMVAPMLVGGWLAGRNVLAARWERHLPETMMARGGRVEYVARHTGGRTALGITLVDHISTPETPSVPFPVLVPWIPSGTTVTLIRALTLPRGHWQIGPATARTVFPFGLIERYCEVIPLSQTLVYPRVGALTIDARLALGLQQTRAERARAALTHEQEDYRGLREFRDGDNPRLIHWRTTARRGRTMIREFDAPGAFDVGLAVEPWLPNHASDTQREALELLLRFAATFGVEWCRKPGATLRLYLQGTPPVLCQGATTPRLADEWLRQLACAQGTSLYLSPEPLQSFFATTKQWWLISLASLTGRGFENLPTPPTRWIEIPGPELARAYQD